MDRTTKWIFGLTWIAIPLVAAAGFIAIALGWRLT